MKIQVPSNLEDIKLGDFQEFLKIEDPSPEDYFRLFLKIDDISNIKASSITDIVMHINNIFEQSNETKLTQRFEFEGVYYGFIPKLDDMSYGENKDITKYVNDFNTIHKALKVLYRPIKATLNNTYLVEPYKGTTEGADAFKELPLSVAFGAKVFFYNLTKDLANYIAKFSVEEALLTGSIKSGESTPTYMRLQREILRKLSRSPR